MGKGTHILFRCFALLAALLLAFSSAAFAHENAHSKGINVEADGLIRVSAVDWRAQNIDRVITAGYPDSLGLSAFYDRVEPEYLEIDGHKCVRASFLAFDVADDFLHDGDVDISIDLLLYQAVPVNVYASYDKNGYSEPVEKIEKPISASDVWQKITLNFKRARFVGRGMDETDFALVAEGTYIPWLKTEPSAFTLCGMKLKRGNVPPKTGLVLGKLKLTIKDENGHLTSARIGIYDETGRAIIPNKQAVSFQFYDRMVRQLKLRRVYGAPQPWPHDNRYIFYVTGKYTDKVPVGNYKIVVSKGPEYTLIVHDFSISAGKKLRLNLTLKRVVNMPEKNWYSGDVHIHLARKRRDNRQMLKFLAAEDVHLSHILQMNNVDNDYFKQFAFGKRGQYQRKNHAIAPGLEAPRTGQRGHSLFLNVSEPKPGRSAYFLYHEYFKYYQDQGAITGYAHVGSEEFLASLGLALDAPFGYVDFVEIMQNGNLRPELWYELLNLGYQIAPTAGSDFPYFDQPGAVRSYVKIDGKLTVSKWMDGLSKGKTFITNGPMIEFNVDGREVGSVLQKPEKQPLKIKASVFVNPAYDTIKSLEIIYCGEVIANKKLVSSTREDWELEVPVSGSGWLALRVKGHGTTQAHSGAIYIDGGDGKTWCKPKVDAQIDTMLKRLDKLAAHNVEPGRELEYWDTVKLDTLYEQQHGALLMQIEKARMAYSALRSELGK